MIFCRETPFRGRPVDLVEGLGVRELGRPQQPFGRALLPIVKLYLQKFPQVVLVRPPAVGRPAGEALVLAAEAGQFERF